MSHSTWPRAQWKSPTHPNGSGLSDPRDCWRSSAGPGSQATDKELRLQFDPVDLPEADDDDAEPARESKILKLFESPLFNSRTVSDFFRKMLGSSRSPGDSTAGAELPVRAVRRANAAGANARPVPTKIRFTDDRNPGATAGVGGALYPEWDEHNNRYRPDWCRVIDFPLTARADIAARRRLSARRSAAPSFVSRRPRPQGTARPCRWRRTRHRGAHQPFRRLTFRLLAARTRLPGTTQTCSQSRRPRLARRLGIGHRDGSGRPGRTRSSAKGGCHVGGHA